MTPADLARLAVKSPHRPWPFSTPNGLATGRSLGRQYSRLLAAYDTRIAATSCRAKTSRSIFLGSWIPAAAVGAALVDLAFASVLLVVIMPFYRASFHLSMMMCFPLNALTAITAAGVGIYTSALNVKCRDIRHALPFAIQVLMFMTPVIYPVSFVPQRWPWLLALNPLSGIIGGFRAAIFGHPLNWQGLAASTGIALGLFVAGVYSFRRMERQFADVI